MKKILSFLFCVLSSYISNSQTFSWQKNVETTSTEGRKIKIDNIGTIFTTGIIYNQPVDMDFGPNVYTLTPGVFSINPYIARYDTDGELLWAKLLFAQSLQIDITDLQIDTLKNVYIIGNFKGTIDFDPGPGVFNLTNVNQNNLGALFIEKLDSNGNFLWVKKIDDAYSMIGSTKSYLGIDSGSNLYILSNFGGIIDFDPSPAVYTLNSIGIINSFILKLNKDGNFIWAKKIEGGENKGSSIYIDNENNILIAGFYNDSVNANISGGINMLYGNLNSNNFFIKYDSNGQNLWARSLNSNNINNSVEINFIRTDGNNNTYIYGTFLDSLDFNPSLGVDFHYSHGGADIFISKYDKNGSYKWTKSFGGVGLDIGRGISIDTSGYFYLMGGFCGTVDLNPNPGLFVRSTGFNNLSHTFFSKFDTSGNFKGAYTFGVEGANTGGFIGHGFDWGMQNQIYITGSLTGILDVDPGAGVHIFTAPGAGGFMFIEKISFCGGYSDTTITACNTINLWGNHYDSSKQFVHFFNNDHSCDSNVSVNLIMNYSVTDTIHPIACNSYTINNTTYTTSGIYVQNYPIGAACDSLFVIDLSIQNPGNLSVIQNQDTLKAYPSGYAYQWLHCGTNQPILGATDSFFIPQVAGSYKFVMYFGNNCNDSSGCKTVTKNVGVQDLEKGYFHITPNPNLGLFTIECDDISDGSQATLYDILGNKIKTFSLQAHCKQMIDIQDLPNAVYLLQVKNEKSSISFKLVKNGE